MFSWNVLFPRGGKRILKSVNRFRARAHRSWARFRLEGGHIQVESQQRNRGNSPSRKRSSGKAHVTRFSRLCEKRGQHAAQSCGPQGLAVLRGGANWFSRSFGRNQTAGTNISHQKGSILSPAGPLTC